MKKPLGLLCLIIFVIFGSGFVAQAGVLRPDLQATLETLGPDDEISVIVTLSDKAEIGHIKDKHKGLRRTRIIRALQEKADLTQRPFKEHLAAKNVRRLIPLWLINGIAFTGKRDVIKELASLPGIESVRPDAIMFVPVTTYAPLTLPEWNLSMIRAPELWSLGYTGRGVVVANMDSGVDGNHPDLKSKWRGGTNSWYDPYGEHDTPFDADGHGTMTMGIMVGGDAGGTAIGVAPGAKWIAVKIFNDFGFTSLSAIHQGFQWLLDPDKNPDTDDAPDIVNNSWGFEDFNECVLEFQPDIQALEAAGIAVVFSAGNDGPDPFTSVSPGNNPETCAVGAVDQFMNIGWFSSRGPAPADCGGRIFPEVVAPGVAIKSSVPGGSYDIASGTSFSAPHVAGAMALLLSAFPDLTVSELELSLKQKALDLGEAGPDNVYGNGLINALEAYYDLVGSTVVVKTFTSIKADDGWVRESSAGSGIGRTKSSSSLMVGDDSRNRQYRSILSFDTSGIPLGTTIKAAILRVKRRRQTGMNPFSTHGPCYVDVAKGTFGSQKLEKTDFQAPATAYQAATLSKPTIDETISTGILNSEGRDAINKGGVTQMRIYCSRPSTANRHADYIKFHSGDDRTSENRPTLEITYIP